MTTTTTTNPVNAEQLASAVYGAPTIDAQDFFEQPDGCQVIKVNGYALRIFDDGDDNAPHGLSWWMDGPEERGIQSDGWEELPADKLADQAASLADFFQGVSQNTIAKVVKSLNGLHGEDFSEVEDFIDSKVDKWATLGDPSDGPDSCSVLVELDGELSVIEWLAGDTFREDRLSIYSAEELTNLLNRSSGDKGNGFAFIIRSTADEAEKFSDGAWRVRFGDTVTAISRIDGLWSGW